MFPCIHHQSLELCDRVLHNISSPATGRQALDIFTIAKVLFDGTLLDQTWLKFFDIIELWFYQPIGIYDKSIFITPSFWQFVTMGFTAD